jgi:ABC-type glycerol-3-phosphate transport system permease component
MKMNNILNKTLHFLALILILGFILFPFLQMLSTSLKGPKEQFAVPVNFIPKVFTLVNFVQAISYTAFVRYFGNSLLVSMITTILAVFIALLGAYGFTRTEFPGRKFFLTLVLFSQMFCLAAIVIPIYKTLGSLKLLNSFPGLIISYLTFSVPVAVWLFRSFLNNIPKELEEAAITEGATKFSAFWKVVVPLLRPAIGAVGAYVFFLTWQEFLFALIIMTNKELRTLPVGIIDFVGQYETNWGNLMAASIILALPVFFMFMFIQKQLIAGLTEGAVKS